MQCNQAFHLYRYIYQRFEVTERPSDPPPQPEQQRQQHNQWSNREPLNKLGICDMD